MALTKPFCYDWKKIENSNQTHSSDLIREVGLGVEGHALKTNLFLYLTFPVIPSSLDVTLTCTYLASGGAPTVVTSVAQLPLRLLVKPCPPIKDADYKITISTNKPPVSLLDLFPEFVLSSTMTNAAGFQV